MNTTDAVRLARKLIHEHLVAGPYAIADGNRWRVELTRHKTAAGLCRYKTRTIALSRPFVELNDVDEVTDTILHEIAHALAGVTAAHGPRWKRYAVRVGARPERCADVANVKFPEYRYKAWCPTCNVQVGGRHRWSPALEGATCRKDGATVVWL